MNKPVAERRTVPGAYVGLLVDVVARWNVTVEQLLDDSDLAAGQLLDPSWQIDFDVYTHLLRRALALTGEPGLGFHLGLQMKVTCHGLIGFAAMIASDVRGALEVAQEFLPLQSSAVGLRLVVEGDMASLYVDQKWPDRALCEAEGFSLCSVPHCRDCSDFERCFGAEDGESAFARRARGDEALRQG